MLRSSLLGSLGPLLDPTNLAVLSSSTLTRSGIRRRFLPAIVELSCFTPQKGFELTWIIFHAPFGRLIPVGTGIMGRFSAVQSPAKIWKTPVEVKKEEVWATESGVAMRSLGS